ncbi:MAG: hypothetical protein ILO36_00815 [Abditibacteriota bacterium]|nr:hypothetical protein [Abditibacteriota bacterium]
MKRPVVLMIVLAAALLFGFAVLFANENGSVSDALNDKAFTRQPGTAPLLPSFKITSYKELYQHPQIPAEVPEKYHKYLGDNNLYTNEIHMTPYETEIIKSLRFGKGEHILYTSCGKGNRYTDKIKKAWEDSGKDIKPCKVQDMPGNTKLYTYDLTELRSKDSIFAGTDSRLLFTSLRNDDGAVIWEYAVEDANLKTLHNRAFYCEEILDVKDLGGGEYMLFFRYDNFNNVKYVYTSEEPRVIVTYTVPSAVTAINAGIYSFPEEGKILSDNSVEARYDDGKARRFKVRHTTEEVIANLIKSGGQNAGGY